MEKCMVTPMPQAKRSSFLSVTLICAPQEEIDTADTAKIHKVRKSIGDLDYNYLYFSRNVDGNKSTAGSFAITLFSGVKTNKRPPLSSLSARDFTAPKDNNLYNQFKEWGEKMNKGPYRKKDSNDLSPKIVEAFKRDIIETWNNLYKTKDTRKVMLITHGTLMHFIAEALFPQHSTRLSSMTFRNYDVLILTEDTIVIV